MSANQTISAIATELERVPERVEDAKRALDGWRTTTFRVVRKYPGRSVLGAIALGFVIGKIGKYI